MTVKEVSSFLIDKQTIEAEREQLLDFLRHIARKLSWIKDRLSYKGDNAHERAEYVKQNATIQVVFWDELQEKALRDANTL